jgi:hypothetical protein
MAKNVWHGQCCEETTAGSYRWFWEEDMELKRFPWKKRRGSEKKARFGL